MYAWGMNRLESLAELTGIPTLDFIRFHEEFLPGQLSKGAGRAGARDMEHVTGSLTLRLDTGEAFNYRVESRELCLAPGSRADATEVLLDAEAFAQLACEALSFPGLLYSGRCEVTQGDPGAFLRWEPALRALYFEQAILDPLNCTPCGDDGSPLDPLRSFDLQDITERTEEVTAHFSAMGFVLIRNVFDADEIKRFEGEASRLRYEIEAGHPNGWWGKNAAGESICTRVNYANDASATLNALFTDKRIESLVPLAGVDVRAATDRVEGITVLYKTADMTEGLSDLPWHRDCGMGGHAVMCPLVNLSIYLDDATEEKGELRFLPGSGGGVSHSFVSKAGDPMGVAVPARAGDVTLHLSDVLHAAPPPTAASSVKCRTSLILTYPHVRAFDYIDVGQAYNDVLLASEDGQVKAILDEVRD
jgi:ectoine hydroxylase-related dioxygenase (phytanoyl-CoA dioxygenase family)